MSVRILKLDKQEVEGEVASKCAMGYYRVKIKIDNGKIVQSECECGEKMCKHAVKLYLRFMRLKGEGVLKS
ncbi:SWIM zinc finger family protein [Sulfuracidifex tepidarius]|uniref:SWIM-type domain-containing protein n=1 Tax=Sulfuracidifex tepidarius TaxID=1294262 RepID=A0A510E3C6_9CREN|nr:SWIM zinc finger family protein [Sulfuracidifex tepidarius]BBG24256.1 hypothetical protein IC006_1565 [Sulfuracidifex tepidarius]BBG27013.1 hypothetical protein IC007_1542 [Sulfuracidifex tepidarius]